MDGAGSHSAQTTRIREKLERARSMDSACVAFGADMHRYFTGPVLSEGEIAAFERANGVKLPGPFSAFLTSVGNGGITDKRDTAGPFYGLFPLGTGTNAFLQNGAAHLRRPAVFRPDMTDAEWAAMIAVLDDEDISDAEWDERQAEILGGVLPLGHQGCTAYHGLVLNGPHAGRVVNLDVDGPRKPSFAEDAHFLDWYERWLDDVLSGRLLRNDGYWFGYSDAGESGDAL